MSQNILTQRNAKKHPQYVIEGTTAATYGIIPATPTTKLLGINGVIINNDNPIAVEKVEAGKFDRIKKDKISEDVNITIRYNMTKSISDTDTLEGLYDTVAFPTHITKTPDESRTYFDSYIDNSGTEIFRTFLGCKPTSATFTTDRLGYVTMEINYFCKLAIESTTLPVGVGSTVITFQTGATTEDAYKHGDAGPAPFIHNGTSQSISTISITVTFTVAPQDALGTTTALNVTPTTRRITGSVSIYKKNSANQNFATNLTVHTTVYTFDTIAASTFNFTDFLFMPSNEEFLGDDAAALMEVKSFEANSVTVTI